MFTPDKTYVDLLAGEAERALMEVSDIWPLGFPQDLADYAGLFTPARFVAYAARVARPQDGQLSLFRTLVSGMSEPYHLKEWRVETTIDNIVEWVLHPEERGVRPTDRVRSR